jgi:hypothetical protein
MPDPFTIRIFVPDGNPEGVRIIDRMNWTGLGIAFPRNQWTAIRQRGEFSKPGVYILVGQTEDDLPTIYIGQGDGVRDRIEAHFANKEFWDWGVTFVSHGASAGLNRAHITWLEHALIDRATKAGRSNLDNGNAPREPGLSEAERADTQGFLKEILQILPLVGLQAFEMPRAVVAPMAQIPSTVRELTASDEPDTIIVPAQKEGFDKVFLGENAWYAIRISGGMLPKIKYIAAYQSQPISAITHFAPVARIEPYGEGGKYKVLFSEPAQTIGPIPFGNAPSGATQGPRYTTLKRLRTAKTVTDILGNPTR